MSDDTPHLEVGQRIVAARGQVTQAAFADALGLDRKTVVRWEAGQRLPDGQSLQKMWRTYRIDAVWLLTGEQAAPELSAREVHLLMQYRSCGDLGRRAVDAVLEAIGSSNADPAIPTYTWLAPDRVQEPAKPYGKKPAPKP